MDAANAGIELTTIVVDGTPSVNNMVAPAAEVETAGIDSSNPSIPFDRLVPNRRNPAVLLMGATLLLIMLHTVPEGFVT